MTAIQSLIEQLERFANESSSKGSSNQSAEAAQQVAEELIALQAIYSEECIGLLTVQRTQSGGISTVLIDETADEAANAKGVQWEPTQPIRLAFTIPLGVANFAGDGEESITIRLSANTTVRKKARELIESWYEDRQAHKPTTQGAQTYDEEKEKHLRGNDDDDDDISDQIRQLSFDNSNQFDRARSTSAAVKLVTSPAISERKSTFVGHAAALHDPADVPIILANLLQDRRIARATHPTMYAWVCKVKDNNDSVRGANLIHRDCDDDGETAAGGRLAHLLDLCHVENGIVIVTRWYGGVHLGADRFKLINRAARDALELAELVDGPLNPQRNNPSKGRKDH
ncbi:hypothetical protein L7F22_019192 [Adiantum nelumboides]|nr:hypothetical protein [Adiantum nelumboides]